MKRNALASVVLLALAVVTMATAAPEAAHTNSSQDGELAADLEALQGTWELATGKEVQGAAGSRSVKTITGNRETVRRYRLPTGELSSEHTVEFTLRRSGAVRVFTFFPVGGEPEQGRSYVYRVDHDDFFDVPGLLAGHDFDNYQVLPKVWHWKRVVSDKASELDTLPSSAKPAASAPQAALQERAVAVDAGLQIKEPWRANEAAAWGAVVDPDKDCDISKGVLRIQVPPTNHDLNPLRGLSAPRVLRPVTGDFEVSVKVTSDLQPGMTAVGKGSPFNGAGLLIWEDAENFLRIERNAWRNGDSCLCYPPLIEYWHERQYSGANKQPVPAAEFFPEASTWLKATRRGNRITVFMSHDGKKWKEVRSLDVKLATELQVGVAALNTSDKPFRVEFDDFILRQN
ncbi:MAG: DUF1349 domain-containing protein [Planctomycetes bacterium]|nr:DUF1349 domain-containing protein [Planctomycetota bacterium]